jgi:hypothetical protein
MATNDAGKALYISVSSRRKIGNEEVEIRIETNFVVHGTEDRRAGFERLYTVLDEEFGHYLNRRVRAGEHIHDGDGVVIPVDTIVKELSNGKEYIKFKGGEFSQWGVNCYKEVWQGSDLQAAMGDAVNFTPPSGWKAVVVTDGQGRKKIAKMYKGE